MNHPVPAPPPPPPAPAPAEGLRTSIDDVLRLILGRIDPARTTPRAVRDALAAAGVTVNEQWAADWIARTAELREAHADD